MPHNKSCILVTIRYFEATFFPREYTTRQHCPKEAILRGLIGILLASLPPSSPLASNSAPQAHPGCTYLGISARTVPLPALCSLLRSSVAEGSGLNATSSRKTFCPSCLKQSDLIMLCTCFIFLTELTVIQQFLVYLFVYCLAFLH